MRKLLVRLGILSGCLLLLALGLVVFVIWQLRASLPHLDGKVALSGLQNPVQITRDALGVPEILATNRADASRALGFVHAQERCFQMDLLRRRGAGELAALLGPALLEHDQDVRRHQLRAAARDAVSRLSAGHRAVLDAYVDGVNAGIAALGARPPEYFLLRSKPAPWMPEDSLLVGYAMYFTLQDPTASHERIPPANPTPFPAAALAFFRPDGSDWDAALDGTRFPTAPMPGPEILDFSKRPAETAVAAVSAEPNLIPGSNSWGVEGASSATGAAIVANDMHLDLGLPNIWFRVSLRWTDPTGTPRRMVGASLPGVPALIIGSNGRIAWGFTNATLDSTDRVLLEIDPADASRYRTPDGWKPLETVRETLAIQGAPAQSITFKKTIWGPVFSGNDGTQPFAVRWIAHDPGALNLGLLDLESAASTTDALALAPECHIPMQNFLVGDDQGRLAWTLIGLLPDRVGFDGNTPQSWADGRCHWAPSPGADRRPQFVASRGQRLWTANNRILGTPEYLALGAFQTDGGARARQIRDDLLALPATTDEAGLLSIHRDDRALFLERWQQLLQGVLNQPPSGTNAQRWSEARRAVEGWGGRAATESVGYRLVRTFRFRVLERIYQPVLRQGEREFVGFDTTGERVEAPFWLLATAKPHHLLNSRFPSYEALFADAFESGLADLDRQNLPIAQATWGARNTSRIQHPISQAVPRLARFLDLPPVPLPGDDRMPRVQGPSFGASERMVVSPGHEERGLFHMPGGQSGHFLSPYYRAGHDAWVNVEPTPLLPGPARHTLILAPYHPR